MIPMQRMNFVRKVKKNGSLFLMIIRSCSLFESLIELFHLNSFRHLPPLKREGLRLAGINAFAAVRFRK